MEAEWKKHTCLICNGQDNCDFPIDVQKILTYRRHCIADGEIRNERQGGRVAPFETFPAAKVQKGDCEASETFF